MTDNTEPHLKPLADAIEEALTKWLPPVPCQFAQCGRDDCARHLDRERPGPCRARSEYIAARISGAAKVYAGGGRDAGERIAELLASSNELLERARKAEAVVADAKAELSQMGDELRARMMHHYAPSTVYMGDCAVCGNREDGPYHIPREATP